MSHRRRRCSSCLELVVLEDALVTSDELGALVFCDAACAEDFERAVEPRRFDAFDSEEGRTHDERELREDFDPIAEDTDD